MAKLKLNLATLGDLDAGRARAIIDAEIAAAIADLDDRGDDGEVRKVKIELALKQNKHGKQEVIVRAKAELPPRRVHPTNVKIAHDPKSPKQLSAFFQEEAPDNADQETFEYPNDK